MPRRVKAADAGVLDQQTEQRDAEGCDEQPEPEVAEQSYNADQEIRADGEERAVREVRDVEHARDERQAEAHQGVQHPGRDPVEDLAEEEVQRREKINGVRSTFPATPARPAPGWKC